MTENIVFSPRRCSFVNKPGQSFRAEEYTDVNGKLVVGQRLDIFSHANISTINIRGNTNFFISSVFHFDRDTNYEKNCLVLLLGS